MPNNIRDEYFNWLFDLVCEGRFSSQISYSKLLARLHDTRFKPKLSKDRNRADDGVNMRRRFILEKGYEKSYDLVIEDLAGPCSVLEMMIALAIRCEEDISDDPSVGDRIGQWFWNMVSSLGLGSMYDSRFDIRYVDDVITRFHRREYEPNGRGGLFTVPNCSRDLRTVEIWYQLNWYLDSILDTSI